MKILYVTQFFSPVHGGSAEAPYRLARELALRGHDLTVYTSDYKLDNRYISSLDNVKVAPFRSCLNLAKFNVTPGIIGQARKEVREFDIIHMHNYRTFQNLVVRHYARRHRVPYVLQAHGSLLTLFQRAALKKAFDRLWGHSLLQDASVLLAIGEKESKEYQILGVSPHRTLVVNNGIYLKDFSSLPERGAFRQKHGLRPAERFILYLGRIEKPKGLDLLLKAFSQLPREFAEVRLAIVGPDEGYAPSLKVTSTELGLGERVLFTGPLYGRDKLEAYVDADVFVLPSYHEVFGISALEAAACNIPVIVTDRCGIAGVIQDYPRGYVVTATPEELQRRILYILSGQTKTGTDNVKWDKVLRDHDWLQIARQMETVYTSCLNR